MIFYGVPVPVFLLVIAVLAILTWYLVSEHYQAFLGTIMSGRTANVRFWRAVGTLAPILILSSIAISIGISIVIKNDALETIFRTRWDAPVPYPSILQILFVLSLITATLVWLGFRRNPATSQVRVVTIDDVLGEEEPETESDWEDEVEPPMSTPRKAPGDANEIHFRRGTVA